MEIIRFIYDGNEIEFQPNGTNVMVNATEMAKIYGKQVVAFLRNDDTKNFIAECLKSDNSHFLGIKTETDLFNSKQKSGTFMHRVLALKFAAWLNPAFELWVYITIDKLLHQHFTEQKTAMERKIELKHEREQLIKQLKGTNPDIDRYLEIDAELKKAQIQQTNAVKEQFKQLSLNFHTKINL